LFTGFDQRLAQILIGILGNTPQQAATTATSGKAAVWTALSSLTAQNWRSNCQAAQLWYQYLEDQIVANDNSSFVTIDKLLPVLGCKQDCNFNRLLSKQSNFTGFCVPTSSGAPNCGTNLNAFANNVIPVLPPNAASQCKTIFTSLAAALPSASSNPAGLATQLQSNPNQISLLSSKDVALLGTNATNAISVAQALGSSGIQINPVLARSLAVNLPPTTNITTVASLASGLPLSILKNAVAADLLTALPKMDLGNMNPFTKSFISGQIAKANDSSTIQNFLKLSTDTSLVNSIPTSQLISLNLNSIDAVSSIPPNNLPKAFLKNVGRSKLKSSTLDTITYSSDTFSKLLPSVVQSDLSNITSDSNRMTAISNLVVASTSQLVNMTSNQRMFFLSTYLQSMISRYGVSNLTALVSFISTTDATNLYPIFIEANSTVLTEFSKFSTFANVISAVAKLSASQCCSFSRVGLKSFASFAVSYSYTYTNLALNDLYTLGPCISANLPYNVLANISSDVYVSYFSTLGTAFQPDASTVTLTQTNIQTYYTSYSANSSNSVDTFAFSTLSDLAMFFPWTTYRSAFSNSSWTTSGASLLSTMNSARSPTSNSLCQFGLTNTATFTTLINSYASVFVDKYISVSSSSRRKRAVSSITCSTLSNLGSPAIGSVPAATLSEMNTTEFGSCLTLLGYSANSWSSAQLTALVSLTKAYVTAGNTISDTTVGQLNSILTGFAGTNAYSESDLANLPTFSISTLSTLGALTGWSSTQLTYLNTPISAYITASSNSYSDFIQSGGNLLCALNTTTIMSIPTAQFSVTSLSKISISCPNIAAWYSYATTKVSSYSSAYASSSALTELGSVVAGISTSDIALVTADNIGSISSSAWTYMPAATVNAISSSALSGLTTDAVSALLSNPNAASFSSAITSSLNTAAGIKSNANVKHISLFTLILSSLLAFALFKF